MAENHYPLIKRSLKEVDKYIKEPGYCVKVSDGNYEFAAAGESGSVEKC